jgi:hypothetical protein
MGVDPILSGLDPAAVASVESTTPVSAGSTVTAASAPSVGPAATWWISPPGVFFSVLHEVSQQYPVELKAALASALRPTDVPDEPALANIAGEVAHAAPPVRRGATQGILPYGTAAVTTESPPAAPSEAHAVSTLDRLLGSLARLAQESPAELETVARQIAAGFDSAASAATGPGALAMATLASQLYQSALMGGPDPMDRQTSDVDQRPPGPVPAVGPVLPTR